MNIDNTNKPIVFTFSNAAEITEDKHIDDPGYSPWGFEFVKKRGLNVISFSAFQSECWYRSPKLHDCIETILSKVALFFPCRFAYGSSMGGFAASAFADVLGIDKLLIINPLSSLNHEIVPFETRFKYGTSLNWKNKYNDGANTKASGYVVFDPLYDLDAKHAKRYNNLKKLKFFGVGHAMPAHLKSIGILSDLFDKFVANEITNDWFYKAIRKRRAYHHYYDWMMCKQNRHLTLLRKSIIKNYFLELKIEELNEQTINREQINIIRDSAIQVEKTHVDTALNLMNLALFFRPEGLGIRKKIMNYKNLIKLE